MSEEALQSSETSATAPESGVNWSELDGESSDWGEGAEDSQSPSDVQSEAVAPVSLSPVETPQPAASPEQTQPPVQPVTQQTPPVEPAQQQLSQEERLAQQRASLETAYSLSADDVTSLLTQPEAVLPKLAAQVHLNVMREMQTQMYQMMQAVPAMLQAETEKVQREEGAKNEMYGSWPGLREHHAVVVKNANMIRQANPQISKQQLIEMTGMMTAVSLGLDPAAVKARGQVQSQAPQQRIPPRPVNVAGAPAGLQPPPQNTFSTFADEDADWMR